MSTLTKVFVVLLAIFSIAFTSMTVAIVARTTNWRDVAEKREEHARIADTNLRHQIASSAALLATAQDEVRTHQARIGELEASLEATRGEAAQLRTQIAAVTAEKSSTEALNRGLLAQLESARRESTEYRDQRNDLEKRNIELERRNIDMNDRINELTAEIDVQLEQKRHFEQQIHILQEENRKLARAGGVASSVELEDVAGIALPGVRAETPVAARAIRGTVLEVVGDLITLSVGGADGVKKGMVFVIHRGKEYVGDIKIGMVEPDRSAGNVALRPTATVQPGDRVTDLGTMTRSSP